MLAGYAFVAGLVYGLLLNMWFWPYGASAGSEVSFVPGAGLAENLRRFWGFHLATSLGWDLPRAVVNSVLVLVFGAPVLAALRRVARRAAFGAPIEFAAHPVDVDGDDDGAPAAPPGGTLAGHQRTA